MAGRDFVRNPDGPVPRFGLSLLGLTLLGLSGCGSAVPDAVALPPVSQAKAEAPPKPQGDALVASPPPPTVVVIDSGADGAPQPPRDLAQAAREERARRAQAGKPVAVIDNRNLAEFSKGQTLTVADGTGSAAPAAATAKPVAAADGAARDETYWRNRGLEIRQQWREAADRIVELESRAEELRRKFYAADDPYVRDSQIKPEWDHALDELDSTRRSAERAELDLERFLNEGREAGAFPGWLREGSELEPERKITKAPDGEPTEPVVVEEQRNRP